MASPARVAQRVDPSNAGQRAGKSIIWFAAGLILATGVAVVTALLLLRSQALSDAGQRGDALAHAIEEQTTRTLQAVDLRLQIASSALAQAAPSKSLDAASASALLREQLRDLPFVRAIWVLDAQGRIVQDSDVGNLGVALGDRPYFLIHRRQPPVGLYVGDPVISRTMGGWMINMSRPIAPVDGRFSGVIVAALRPDWFARLWASVGLGSGDVAALIRRDGMLMMRSPLDNALLGRPVHDLSLLKPPLSSAAAGSFQHVSGVDGVERLYAFRNLSTQPDLRVLIGLEVDALLEPWRRVALFAGAAWLAAAGVAGALALKVQSDLTRRFAVEQEMRRNVQRLNLALSGGNLGQWDWDAASGRMSVNDRWMTMLGLDPRGPAPTGDSWRALVHPDDVPKIDGLMQEVILNPEGREFEIEVRARHADGREVWVLDKGVVVERDADGCPLRVAGTRLDITDRKLAEEALRDSELRYRELFDSNPQPMWVFDLETLAFLAVNAAALTQYGYSREEFLAMTIADIRPPEDVQRLREHAAQLVNSRPDEGHWTHRRKDGSLIQVDITSHWLRYGPRPSRLVLATDVTAREQAEAEKVRLNAELESHRHHLEELVVSRTAELAAARQQAEDANRSKSAFLANMSHEIRTPLNAILGMNYLIRRETVTPAQAVRLEKIDAAGQHLLSIINDVLDLSKIEAGRVQIESTNFRLSAVLDGVQSIIAEAARSKGLTVNVDGNAVPIWLRGDPTRLRQALLNFAGNAVKFTAQGSISLKAKLLSDDGDELYVRFSVEDTGIGIAPEHVPRLFQVFEQADSSITRKFGGTGLGLAISQRLAGLLGGECGVESKVGEGSVFWFTARLQRGHGVMPSQPLDDTADGEAQLRARHRGARILLVEDNPVNLEVALAMLHVVGLDVDTAIDGREAVDLAAVNSYDLVLMDMQMPEMGGLEATRLIRALEGWQTRPILALTANAFDDDRQACYGAGMNDFITKPMQARQLYATVLYWLDAEPFGADQDQRRSGAGIL